VGERKLLEINYGKYTNSRFTVCHWDGSDWYFDERPGWTLKDFGCEIIAIYDLPPLTQKPSFKFL
jgi:hypothetical protein